MDNPPSSLVFEMHRRATGGTSTLTADLVAGSNPVSYEAQWNVTQEKGRWEIKTRDYISNTLQFKIDKREQIDYVANSYVGELNGSAGGGDQCQNFVAAVYGYLGLTFPSGSASVIGEGDPTATPPLPPPTAPDTQGYGCLTLFHGASFPVSTWQHVAINVGNSIVDQNCGSYVANPMPGPGQPVPPALIDKHSATAAHLSQPNHYEVREDRNTHEMFSLDNE